MLNNHLERCVSPLAVRTCSHALRLVWETCLGFSELTIIIFIRFRTFMWSGQVCPRNHPHSYSTNGTWKSYKSVNSNRVGWFRTGFVTRELTQRSVHRVRSRKFDGCVAKRQENFIRFEMCVSKSRSQQVSFELVSWLHKRLTLVPSCIDIVKLGCRYCAITLVIN